VCLVVKHWLRILQMDRDKSFMNGRYNLEVGQIH
jgi:hypothetical protein